MDADNDGPASLAVVIYNMVMKWSKVQRLGTKVPRPKVFPDEQPAADGTVPVYYECPQVELHRELYGVLATAWSQAII